MSVRPCLNIRPARAEDGAGIYRMIAEVGSLERNSCYAYILLTTHFADTCFVAEERDSLAGFVLGYRPPREPDTVFVWQIAVQPSHRGLGVGDQLLGKLVEAPACVDALYLTATVSSDNTGSLALFHGFAKKRAMQCMQMQGFPARLFADAHPDENLLRIGPLKGIP